MTQSGKDETTWRAAQAKRGSLGKRLDSREGSALEYSYSHTRAPEMDAHCQLPVSA